jgi:hypothetical protein
MLSARDVHGLLASLCADHGFCLPPAAQTQLEERPPADTAAFTQAVFLAEGLDPATADRRLYRRITEVIAEAFRRSEARREEEP